MKRMPLVVTGTLCLFFLLSAVFIGSPCLYAKEIENFGEFGNDIKAIADEMNQRHPYIPITMD